LYTSLLPNLLVPELLAATHASRALKVYVCNIATEVGETDLYSCSDHMRALEEHVGPGLFDLVLCNENYEVALSPNSRWVEADEQSMKDGRLYCADLPETEHPWRHDPAKLAKVLMDLYYERTGPLSG